MNVKNMKSDRSQTQKEYVLCGCTDKKCLEKANLYRKNGGYPRPGQDWKHSGGKFRG